MIIPNTLKMLQDLVGGYIEAHKIADNVVLICNEDGKRLGLEPNFFVGAFQDVIVGPVIIAGENGDVFESLSDEDANLIMRILRGGFEV